MTPEELAEVEERCAKATPGPWEAERAVDLAGFEQNDLWIIMRGQPCAYRFDRTEDAEFCAHARADVPALCAEVRRLREENERTRGTIYDVLGNGADEAIWPPGMLFTDALRDYVRRLIADKDQAVHAAQANTTELCRAWKERDDALAEVSRLREALDAAQRIVKRKADREAGREET